MGTDGRTKLKTEFLQKQTKGTKKITMNADWETEVNGILATDGRRGTEGMERPALTPTLSPRRGWDCFRVGRELTTKAPTRQSDGKLKMLKTYVFSYAAGGGMPGSPPHPSPVASQARHESVAQRRRSLTRNVVPRWGRGRKMRTPLKNATRWNVTLPRRDEFNEGKN